jgi:predicted RNase H-like HicB family nuclease
MSQEFSVIVEKDSDGYYVASVPSLPGCHTQAKSLDKLIERIQEAIELCIEFDSSLNDTPLEFIGIQKVTVQI